MLTSEETQEIRSRVYGRALLPGDDGGGFRWYLDGKPVHCGDALELHTNKGWASVRLEQERDRPVLYLGLRGGDQAKLYCGPEALFRWPRR